MMMMMMILSSLSCAHSWKTLSFFLNQLANLHTVSSIQYRNRAACSDRIEARMEEIDCVSSGVFSTIVRSGISERQRTLTTTSCG